MTQSERYTQRPVNERKRSENDEEEGEAIQAQNQCPPRPATPNSGDRRAHEKMMQDLQRILNQQEFGSVEEANQFMQQLDGPT